MFQTLPRLFSVLAILLLTIGSVAAQPTVRPQESAFVSLPWEMVLVQEYLGLTGQQLRQWHQLQIERGRELVPLNAELREVDRQLQEQLNLDNPSLQLVGELVVRARAVQRKEAHLAQVLAGQLISVLTPEQAAKVQVAGECLNLREVSDDLLRTGFLTPLTVLLYPPSLVPPAPRPPSPPMVP